MKITTVGIDLAKNLLLKAQEKPELLSELLVFPPDLRYKYRK